MLTGSRGGDNLWSFFMFFYFCGKLKWTVKIAEWTVNLQKWTVNHQKWTVKLKEWTVFSSKSTVSAIEESMNGRRFVNDGNFFN